MAVCPNCHEPNPELGAACPRCEGYYYIPEEDAEDAASDPMIGRMAADKYVILGLINEGGMGAVYRALQLPVEREVAFKVLRTELKDSDNGRDRFIREARAVSRLNHPNIITLYDFGFEDGKHPYMVMEYAPGKSLGKWLKTEKLTLERIIHVTAQILNALTEAHERGIVHRDLKPENMIISPRGAEQDYVKLLDFGIARMVNEGATRGLTREGEVFGTPHYMAPEQAQGRKDLGPPADIYAVGIMMYEMLTGETPFDAPTPLAVLFMHISDPLPEIVPREGVFMRPEIGMIVQRACSKDPDARYQDASQMLADIFAVMGFSTSALPGMVGTDPSAEYVTGMGMGSVGTPNPTAQTPAVDTVQTAQRQPHFTPGGAPLGVQLQDPNPTVADEPLPNTTASSPANPNPMHSGAPPANVPNFADHDFEEPSNDNQKMLVGVAVVAIVAVLLAVVGLIVLTSQGDTEGDGPTDVPVANAAETPPAEIAAKDEPGDIAVEALEDPVEEVVEEDSEEGDELAETESDGADEKAEVGDTVATKEKTSEPAVKKAASTKTTTATSTASKSTTTPKTETTSSKTTSTKTTSEKTTEKKKAPAKMKWTRPSTTKTEPKRWDKN